MLARYLVPAIEELCFEPHKIGLVSGPRQCGKTTMGRMLLEERGVGAHHNWDDVEFRRRFAKQPTALLPEPGRRVPLLVLDEIHKAKAWKRTLKGLFDTRSTAIDVIVTGSARLNVWRRSGDSLLGRAIHLRMHPLSVAELARPRLPAAPDDRLRALSTRARTHVAADREAFAALLELGGFPEPFLAGSRRRANVWRRNRLDQVIREDLRDMTRIVELGHVETLAALLPERVGSPFSRAAVREDLEVAFTTVTRWLAALEELYYLFRVRPWTRNVARALKQEPKLYLRDWSEVSEPGPRFENVVACHLLKACDYWSDNGDGDHTLHYLRNKEKQEIDFLIARGKTPWLAVEARRSAGEPDPHFWKYLGYLGLDLGLQLVAEPGVWRMHRRDHTRILVASAGEALAYFV